MDDLGDEWWLSSNSENDGSGKKVDKEKNEVKDEEHSQTQKQAKKRELKKGIEDIDFGEQTSKAKKSKSYQMKKDEKCLPPPCASDFVTLLQKQYDGKLSPVEMDELQLEDSHFSTCNDLTHTPMTYMKTLCPKWKKLSKGLEGHPGAPLILVITGAATRATDLIRQLSHFKTEKCRLGKLFAKHIKLEEQRKFLKRTSILIGVGTPSRLKTLLDNDILKRDCMKYIVLDWTWRDAKKRRLIDIPEVKADLLDLFKTTFSSHVKSTNCKIGLM